MERIGRLHVIISGKVQGVSFRYFTREKALELSLTGWVQNLADGRVEAIFEGKKADLQEVLDFCKRGPPKAEVERVEESWSFGTSQYSDFQMNS